MSSIYPEAMRPPNPFGLFNMAGNVREWMWDWRQEYGASPVENPTGAAEKVGAEKVIRGSCWMQGTYFAQSWVRFYYNGINFRDNTNGFRVVTNSAHPTGVVE